MAGKRKAERDERVKLPLDPETALRALLAVKPDDEPAEDAQADGPPSEPSEPGSVKRSS
jgi:hypothetical protein